MTTLFTRPVEYLILVSLKEHRGILGSKITRREEFSFCAESGEGAKLASSNVKSGSWIDQEVEVQVLGAIPVWVEKAEVFPLVHAPIKSLSEVQSERDEAAQLWQT